MDSEKIFQRNLFIVVMGATLGCVGWGAPEPQPASQPDVAQEGVGTHAPKTPSGVSDLATTLGGTAIPRSDGTFRIDVPGVGSDVIVNAQGQEVVQAPVGGSSGGSSGGGTGGGGQQADAGGTNRGAGAGQGQGQGDQQDPQQQGAGGGGGGGEDKGKQEGGQQGGGGGGAGGGGGGGQGYQSKSKEGQAKIDEQSKKLDEAGKEGLKRLEETAKEGQKTLTSLMQPVKDEANDKLMARLFDATLKASEKKAPVTNGVAQIVQAMQQNTKDIITLLDKLGESFKANVSGGKAVKAPPVAIANKLQGFNSSRPDKSATLGAAAGATPQLTQSQPGAGSFGADPNAGLSGGGIDPYGGAGQFAQSQPPTIPFSGGDLSGGGGDSGTGASVGFNGDPTAVDPNSIAANGDPQHGAIKAFMGPPLPTYRTPAHLVEKVK